jgi:UDP-glucose 4-epimerase
MIYLVTGGAGFIGSHLVEKLISKGAEVKVIDNLSVGNNNIPLLKKLGVQFLQADIGDYEKIKDFFKDVDTVFHLAAMNRASRSIEKPLEAHKSNITGTLNCLEAARHAGVKKFVFISSSSVYAGQRNIKLTEEMPLAPPHPYGVGKLAGEHYARIYLELFGLNTVILRYFSVYGPRQLGTIDKAGVVAKFVHKAVNNTPLEVYGTGKQLRNFSYVKDVVNYTLLASENELAVGQTFNIAAEKEISVNEVAETVAAVTSKTVTRTSHPLPAGDPDRNPANIEKAKKILNYVPQYDFETGISETVDWYNVEGKFL